MPEWLLWSYGGGDYGRGFVKKLLTKLRNAGLLRSVKIY